MPDTRRALEERSPLSLAVVVTKAKDGPNGRSLDEESTTTIGETMTMGRERALARMAMPRQKRATSESSSTSTPAPTTVTRAVPGPAKSSVNKSGFSPSTSPSRATASHPPRFNNELAQSLHYRAALQSIMQQQQPSPSVWRELVGDMGSALFAPLDLPEPLPSPTMSREDDWRDNSLRPSSPIAIPKASGESLGSLTVVTEPESFSDKEDHFDRDSPACIEPEPWKDLQACPRILSDRYFHELRRHFPEALGLNNFERCFAIGRDGDSMITMLDRCRHYRYTLVVVQTTLGHVLGGFATESWNVDGRQHHQRRHSYYGTGQSFLFASHPDIIPGIDEEPEPGHELSVYRWTGDNDYCQICDPEQSRMAMGGEGDFGLIVQDNFEIGETGRSATFRNPPLVRGGHFEIAAFEVYGMVPLFCTVSPMASARSMRSLLDD